MDLNGPKADAILQSLSPEFLNSLPPEDLDALLTHMEQRRQSKAATNFLSFVKAIDIPGAPLTDLEDCEEFYPDRVTPAKHHRLICQTLQMISDGELKRAMFFMPPGSAKSTYTTVCFPPFEMGRKPRFNIICTSYGSTLARKFGRKSRSVSKSSEFHELFGCILSNESSAADEWSLTNHSEYMSGGILSGITGNRADGLIIDDPVKGRAEADSETLRDKIWEAYKDDLFTRLKPNAWQIIIQTRWHEDDLAGRLLPEGYDGRSGMVTCTDGHEWMVLNLPMIAEHDTDPLSRSPGELLWPEWFKQDDIDKLRSDKTRQRTWSALYQQRPTPDEGDYFKREWFNWYDTPPKHLRTYGASDYAVTAHGGDYTVHGVAGVDPNDDIYILDIWREQAESITWVEAFIDLVQQHRPLIWAEEQGQIIKSMDPIIRKRMRERKAYCRREQFASIADKPTRSRSFQARAAMGKVYLPAHAPWTEDLMAELLSFPAGKHDDQVDVLGLIGRILDEMVGGQETRKQSRKRDRWDKAFAKSDDVGSLSGKGF